ncbi:MAG: DUF2911 domain-containing protein [Terriglobia bacterium]
MRRVLLSAWIIVAVVASAGIASAQRNPRATAKLEVKGQAVSVEYGQPSLKGRTAQQLLGQLAPGEVWRLGADKSTTFSTGADLVFGDLTVPKGDYSLWVRKEGDGWKLVFNKQHGQWGTEHNPAQDLGSTPLKESKGEKSEEKVTIALAKEGDGGTLNIQWGDQVLTTSFKAK